ncbi:MAG: hypothetical protein GY844_17720 [Bradyrhizobium sp.]|nr:hypothetical protein [Bradyrhizobium sp.]
MAHPDKLKPEDPATRPARAPAYDVRRSNQLHSHAGWEAEGTMRLASFETMLVLASLMMLALVMMGG